MIRGIFACIVSSLLAVTVMAQNQVNQRPQKKPISDVPPSKPPGTVKVNPKDGQKYVLIPAGTFQMGCSPGDSECFDNEKPAHKVTITKDFLLGQTPVTQAAYERVTGKNPSYFKGANLPVETVTWNEAQRYCSSIGGRLPTEAEWEYAARAGSTGALYANRDATGWYANHSGEPHDVGQKQANAFKLFDMMGSVRQWTADRYTAYYSEAETETDPSWPPLLGWSQRAATLVLRGGSGASFPRDARVSYRFNLPPFNGVSSVGFRCIGKSESACCLEESPEGSWSPEDTWEVCQLRGADAHFGVVEITAGEQARFVVTKNAMIMGSHIAWPLDRPLRGVRWSIEPAGRGVVISSEGVVTTRPDSPTGTYNVFARANGETRETPFQVYRASDQPLVGRWYETAQVECGTGREVSPQTPFEELVFVARGSFTVTRQTFETMKDYWGTYEYNAASGTLTLRPEKHTPMLPADFRPSGTARIDAGGRLVLGNGLWLGTPLLGTPLNIGGAVTSSCSQIFSRYRSER